MASTMFSALASAPEAISPLISTVAVWVMVGLLAGALSLRKIQNTAMANTSHDKRSAVFQRLANLASCKLENTSFSKTCRSLEPGDTGVAARASALGDLSAVMAGEARGSTASCGSE